MKRLWLHQNEDTCVCTYGEVMLKVSIGLLRKILSMQEKDHKCFKASKKEKEKTEMFLLTCLPVEIFKWRRVRPLPASLNVPVIEA